MNRYSFVLVVIAASFVSCGTQRDPAAPANAKNQADARSEAPREQLSGQTPPGGEPKTESSGDYVSIPEVGIKLRRPEEFEKADSFHGFGQPETASSVMAVSIPGPFSEVSRSFTAQSMKERGWVMRSREDMKVDGLPAILVHFEQPAAGQVFLKWCLIFGSQNKTTMITATFPKDFEGELSARLKSSVLSARLDHSAAPAPGDDLPFTVEASKKLKPVPAIGKTLAYNKDGSTPVKSPKDPVFMVSPSLGKVTVDDERGYAERRLLATSHVKRVALKSTEEITIDGLPGFESSAHAEDAESGTPMTIYQVMLFDRGAYILIVGIVGTDLSDDYLPEFKSMARSLRRKK